MNKKQIGAIALAGLMIISMTGCGNSSGTYKKDTKAYKKYVELGDYKGIKYTKDIQEVTDDDVQAQIDTLINQNKEKEEVTGRAVKDGDVVNIDYIGTKDGVAFDGGTADNYDLTIGSHSFIDGFEDGLIGHKTGESVLLDLTFPEDYGNEDLAGAKVNFDVTINSISIEKTPELTDAFIKENTEYDTIAAYKESIKEDLEQQNEKNAEQTAKSDVLKQVISNCKINGYNQAEVTKLVDEEFENFKESAERWGMKYEDFLSMYQYNSEEELKEGITEYVKGYLDQKMVVYCLADAEGLGVTGDEMDKMAEDYMTQYGASSKEEVIDYLGEDFFEYQILYDKVIDFIMKNAELVDSLDEKSSEETEDVTEEKTEESDN